MNIHSSKKMLDMTAGGPGSGRKPGSGVGIDPQSPQGRIHSTLSYAGFTPKSKSGAVWGHDNGDRVVTKPNGDWGHSNGQSGNGRPALRQALGLNNTD